MSSDRLIFGYMSNVIDIKEELKYANNMKMDFVAIHLFHPRYRRDNINISYYRIRYN